MPRSNKKGPFVDYGLWRKILKEKASKSKKIIKTWSRRSMVVPEIVGHTLAIHNGRKFISVFISENMVGHKLGEFVPTRYFKAHAIDKKVKR